MGSLFIKLGVYRLRAVHDHYADASSRTTCPAPSTKGGGPVRRGGERHNGALRIALTTVTPAVDTGRTAHHRAVPCSGFVHSQGRS